LWYMLTRCNSLRWNVRVELVLELVLVDHAHIILQILSLYSVASGLLLDMALGIIQQALSLPPCAPLLVPKRPSGGVRIEPAWSIREACVAVNISLVLGLR
jgi:hypothetical protein